MVISNTDVPASILPIYLFYVMEGEAIVDVYGFSRMPTVDEMLGLCPTPTNTIRWDWGFFMTMTRNGIPYVFDLYSRRPEDGRGTFKTLDLSRTPAPPELSEDRPGAFMADVFSAGIQLASVTAERAPTEQAFSDVAPKVNSRRRTKERVFEIFCMR